MLSQFCSYHEISSTFFSRIALILLSLYMYLTYTIVTTFSDRCCHFHVYETNGILMAMPTRALLCSLFVLPMDIRIRNTFDVLAINSLVDALYFYLFFFFCIICETSFCIFPFVCNGWCMLHSVSCYPFFLCIVSIWKKKVYIYI